MDPREYNFIETYDDAFELCDLAIDYFEKRKDLQQERSELEKSSGVDDIFMNLKYNSRDKDLKKILNACYDSIENCFNLYAKKYQNSKLDKYPSLKNHTISVYKVQKTLPGKGFYNWHYERNYGGPAIDKNGRVLNNIFFEYKRFMVYTIYLNDIKKEGETEFLYQNLKIKPKKGTVCLFPADFMFVHRGNPPKNETKYIITGWLEDKVNM
jgi:hypothetical protein